MIGQCCGCANALTQPVPLKRNLIFKIVGLIKEGGPLIDLPGACIVRGECGTIITLPAPLPHLIGGQNPGDRDIQARLNPTITLPLADPGVTREGHGIPWTEPPQFLPIRAKGDYAGEHMIRFIFPLALNRNA